MTKILTSLLLVAAVLRPDIAQAQRRTLDIYWIDVEGGAATLIVSPSGESLLIDAGYEVDGRDAKRIFNAAQQAGLKRIDYFVLSHFHGDHAGGIGALAKMLPVGHCFDRGDFIEPMNQHWRDVYLSACADRRTILHAGETIPLTGVRLDVVASNGDIIRGSINKGGQANPLCATAQNKPKDAAENQLMLSTLLTFGKFTFLDMADMDWEKEMEFACPTNKLGHVSVYQAGRHGALDGAGAPGFLYAIRPQVIVVNNGPKKGLWAPTAGGTVKPQTEQYDRLAKTPGVEGIWQGHRALFDPNPTHNAPADMIANEEDTPNCQGHWIRASVDPNGRFTVFNSRNGFSKSYDAH
jgi:competence protein ComEC